MARTIGGSIGPFAYLAASLSSRTLETAVAMGFSVDELLDQSGDLWEAAQSELAHREARDDPELYAHYLELLDAGGAVAALGRRQAALWWGIVSKISGGAQALLIPHGGLIEPGLVAALPGWQHARWGHGFKHCEGIRLRHDGQAFVDADILRH